MACYFLCLVGLCPSFSAGAVLRANKKSIMLFSSMLIHIFISSIIICIGFFDGDVVDGSCQVAGGAIFSVALQKRQIHALPDEKCAADVDYVKPQLMRVQQVAQRQHRCAHAYEAAAARQFACVDLYGAVGGEVYVLLDYALTFLLCVVAEVLYGYVQIQLEFVGEQFHRVADVGKQLVIELLYVTVAEVGIYQLGKRVVYQLKRSYVVRNGKVVLQNFQFIFFYHISPRKFACRAHSCAVNAAQNQEQGRRICCIHYIIYAQIFNLISTKWQVYARFCAT